MTNWSYSPLAAAVLDKQRTGDIVRVLIMAPGQDGRAKGWEKVYAAITKVLFTVPAAGNKGSCARLCSGAFLPRHTATAHI